MVRLQSALTVASVVVLFAAGVHVVQVLPPATRRRAGANARERLTFALILGVM